jgi:hypothetical protein
MRRCMTNTVVTVVILLLVQPGYGCECGGRQSPEVAFQSARSVFRGKVTSIRSRASFVFLVTNPRVWFAERDRDAMYRPRYGVVVEFDVIEAWKGDSVRRFVVVTGNGGGDCGFEFVSGQEYVVYTRGVATQETDICTRTERSVDASVDLAHLRTRPSSRVSQP